MDPNTQPQEQPAPPQQPAPEHPRNLHPMVVLQPGEQVVGTIKRHPIGIIMLYLGVGFAAIIMAFLAFLVLPDMIQSAGDSSVMTEVYAGLGLAVVIMILTLGIATSVYWQNEWTITTDSITQITQTGLFGRQVSQLSMDNLEDVTVDQNGILPHMLNYGVLKVESAGERSKFLFNYCPNPNAYARQILDIHEKFLEERRNIKSFGSQPNIQTNSRR